MEKKTKQRVMGVVVIAAFIVILLPFLQSSHEEITKTTLIQAPVFPDQAIQTSNSMDMDAKPSADQSTQEDNLISSLRPHIVQNNTGQAKTTKIAAIQNQTPSVQIIEPKSIEANSKSGTPLKTKLAEKSTSGKNENTGLKLHQVAWVIQIGSFKHKPNALQLVNHLRAHGYHAFIQQISTSLGNSTRVFVGPEEQHAKARKLAVRLKKELQIDGIVISYKPLSL